MTRIEPWIKRWIYQQYPKVCEYVKNRENIIIYFDIKNFTHKYILENQEIFSYISRRLFRQLFLTVLPYRYRIIDKINKYLGIIMTFSFHSIFIIFRNIKSVICSDEIIKLNTLSIFIRRLYCPCYNKDCNNSWSENLG